MEPIRIEVTISAPLDEVWRAWTESNLITEWLSVDAHVEARPGAPFELFWDPDDHDHMCTKGCVFTLVEPRRLGFTWRGPNQFAGLMNDPPLTSVLVAFHDEGDTRVVVEHDGWGDGEEWEQAREWHRRAWEEALEELKSMMEPGARQ